MGADVLGTLGWLNEQTTQMSATKVGQRGAHRMCNRGPSWAGCDDRAVGHIAHDPEHRQPALQDHGAANQPPISSGQHITGNKAGLAPHGRPRRQLRDIAARGMTDQVIPGVDRVGVRLGRQCH